ncbi:hypothetical protein JHK86_049564 [Glycine max]|nr:hypothetical protein JHK86_049564 [Glycine max]
MDYVETALRFFLVVMIQVLGRGSLCSEVSGKSSSEGWNSKFVTYTDNQVPPQDPGPYPQALIIETYTPPDPGPYPQDQPKQNSVRFTPTQVNSALDLNHILSLFMHNDFSFNLSLPPCFPHNS